MISNEIENHHFEEKLYRYPPGGQLAYQHSYKTIHTEAPQAAARDGTRRVGAHVLVNGDQMIPADDGHQRASAEKDGG